MDADLEAVTTLQKLVVALFGLMGTLLVVFIFMTKVDREPFQNLGLNFIDHQKDIVVGISTGLLIMGTGLLILLALNQLGPLEIDYLGDEFLMTIVLFLLVAISEEIVFRGYVLKNLMLSMNKSIALVLSAILFTLAHAANPNLSLIGYANLFLAGILLGLPYIYTKNLMFPIAFHFSWNFFQSIFGFNVSGLDSYSLIAFNIPEDTILNGGDFGFEGSMIAILFQVLMIGLCQMYFRNWKNKAPDILNEN